MLHIALCDDNIEFATKLRDTVNRQCESIFVQEGFTVGAVQGSGAALLAYMETNPVDVVLLDIDMPEMNGFDVARRLCQSHPAVIIVFVSGYDNFVYSAFEFMPFAYIRKSRIADELPKVFRRIAEKRRESERQIILLTNAGEIAVDAKSIAYAESRRNYVSVKLVDRTEHSFRGTLTEFEKTVKEHGFFRIHSAYLVNLSHVERMIEGHAIVNGISLPISQRRLQAFKKAYMDYTRRSFVL